MTERETVRKKKKAKREGEERTRELKMGMKKETATFQESAPTFNWVVQRRVACNRTYVSNYVQDSALRGNRKTQGKRRIRRILKSVDLVVLVVVLVVVIFFFFFLMFFVFFCSPAASSSSPPQPSFTARIAS